MVKQVASTVVLFLMLAAVFTSAIALNHSKNASGTENLSVAWLEGWTYRKSHVINPSSGAGTGYQVRIVAHYGSGTDNGENVYLNNHSRTDFGDLRFTADDGVTLLSYWMESKVNNDYAIFWVKVDADLNTTAQTIYIYYGNTAATTTSNGADTFQVFDDFDDLSQWTIQSGDWTIENGSAKCTSFIGEIKKAFSHNDGAILYRAKLSQVANYWRAIVGYRSNAEINQGYRSYWGYISLLGGKRAVIAKSESASWGHMVYTSINYTVNTWYIAEARFVNSYHEFEFNRNEATVNTTDSFKLSNSHIFIQIDGGASTDYPVWFDWYAFRKYVEPEPSHGSWSSEFEQGIIRVPDNYLTIQEAINNAYEGDTIVVKNGTYYENIIVNKSLSLIGENRSNTIIDGNGGGTAVHVTVGPLYISGFTIQNGSTYGIYFEYTAGNTVKDNVITKNGYGIYVWMSGGNNISGNIISNNTDDGIHISGSAFIADNVITSNGEVGIHISFYSGGNIVNNTVVNNWDGIWLSYSPNSKLRANDLADNSYNFGVSGDYLHHFTNLDIDTSNTVDGKPIYYLIDKHDLIVDSSTFPDAGYIGLINSTNIVVRDLNLTNNGQGMLFAFTNESVIENVTALNNFHGVLLESSRNNTITENVFINNYEGIRLTGSSDSNVIVRNDIDTNREYPNTVPPRGMGIMVTGNNNRIYENNIANFSYSIYLTYSSRNVIYHNNLINNTNVYVYESYNNTWDNGCEGNYWSNYNGTDLDGDGIGDTHLPWEDVDNYPLMNLYWNPADIDHDLDVDIFDVVRAASAYGSTPSDPNWNPHCDISEPYGIIDIFDIVTIAGSYGERWQP